MSAKIAEIEALSGLTVANPVALKSPATACNAFLTSVAEWVLNPVAVSQLFWLDCNSFVSVRIAAIEALSGATVLKPVALNASSRLALVK